MQAEIADQSSAACVLEARGVTQRFARGRWPGGRREITALNNVSLGLRQGETLAVVGETGCGKSTLARILTGLLQPDAGEVWFRGRNLGAFSAAQLRGERRHLQLVFQHSAAALNPRFSAFEAVEEPLRVQRLGTAKERRDRVQEWLERVALPPDTGRRRCSEFSGGQKQRLALARALILEPAVLLLDEALSGLDRFTQSQMLEVLVRLRASLKLSLLFITHDLRLAANIADQIAVLHAGTIVEHRPTVQIVSTPAHPYTRELLLAAAPPPAFA